jgi:hypothetical protein
VQLRLFRGEAHAEVIRLDVSVKEVAGVDVLEQAYELQSKLQYSSQREAMLIALYQSF